MFESQLFTQFLVVLLLLIIGGHIWFLRARGLFFAFDPINYFWGGVLVIMVQQPLEYWDRLVSFMGNTAFWINVTMMGTLVGTIFIIIGYHLPHGPRFTERYIPKLPVRLDPIKLRICSFGLLLSGLYAYSILFQSAGGFSTWIAVSRGGTDDLRVSQYVALLSGVVPIAVAFYLICALRKPVFSGEKLLAWTLAFITWLWFVYLGSRSRTIVYMMMFVAIYYIVKKRNPSLLIFLAIVPSLWLITQYQAAYRGNFTNLSFNLDRVPAEEAMSIILPAALGGDELLREQKTSPGVEFNVAATVVRLVPFEVSPSLGYDWLEFLTRPIPRRFWPGEKPYPALVSWQPIYIRGQLTNSRAGNTDYVAGPAPGWTGYWWRLFGPLGMIIGGVYTGVFFRALRELYHADRNNASKALLYMGLAPIGFMEAAATPFAWIVIFPLGWILPNLILIWICRKTERAGEARAATNANAGATA